MPYYIYRVTQLGPVKQLVKLADCSSFKAASLQAKQLRQESDAGNSKIQVIFGENELQAEESLNALREPRPVLGDDF